MKITCCDRTYSRTFRIPENGDSECEARVVNVIGNLTASIRMFEIL